ncbi:MAG TPA: ATP-binding protein [Blastocatellia bacterium]|jgi:PAS domain S-box-containing protein|nr:ATP-binding protein [Blastocatellia bacterium]
MLNGRKKRSYEDGNPLSPSEAEAILIGLANAFIPFELAARRPGGESVALQKKSATVGLPDLEAKYRTLVEQIPAVVFMAYLDRGISEAYISPQIESILGFSQQEWLNDPVRWYNQLHPDDKARWSIEAARLFLSGEALQSTYRLMARDGHVVWLHCEAKMVRHDDGRPWFIHGVSVDISDLKQSEEALRKAHDELEMRVRQRTAELARTNAELEAEIVERKAIQEQLEEEREIVETVSSAGRMLSAELYLDKLMQALTDAATELVGAQFGAFFHNVPDEGGGSYMLYALSGAPREHFERFPTPRASDLFGPTFRGKGIVRLDDVKQDPRFGKNLLFNRMPHGHLTVTSYLAIPVVSRSGEVLGGLFFGHPEAGIFSERSERILLGLAAQAAIAIDNARLYAAEQKARAEAETANRLKDDFLATVSHELRAPLHSMFGWVQLLRSGKLDANSAQQAIEVIERNVQGQRRIVEDILDVSRIITGKLRIEMAPVNLTLVIEAAVDSMRPAAEAKGIALKTTLDPKANRVSGDAGRLQQVVWNLISNAIKFTPQEGRVQILTENINSNVEIKVIDTGPGIKPEFLPYVFDRFRQEDSSITRAQGGLGLGLSIVRHLVELHGGAVAAENRRDAQGAIFTVRLPLAAATATKPSLAAQAMHFGQAPLQDAPQNHTSALAGLRVLLVDDETDGREMVTAMLENNGIQVKAASSANEALQTIAEWKPDVLVSDIGMPVDDGYALIRKVRALPSERGGNVPAAALTGYASRTDYLKALSAGYQSHIKKPVELDELIAVVASLAGRTNKG